MGISGSRTDLPTSQELEIVQSTWKVVMEDPEGNGLCILKTFLDKHDYYSIFDKWRGTPVSELPQHPVFRRHALYIIQAIDDVIRNLSNNLVLEEKLIALGKSHGKKNIIGQQFLELKVVILDILTEKFNLSPEGLAAWNKTYDVAYNYIQQGLSS